MTTPLTAHMPARALLVEVPPHREGPHAAPHWEIVWEGTHGSASSGQRYELHAARGMAVECGAHEIEERACPRA